MRLIVIMTVLLGLVGVTTAATAQQPRIGQGALGGVFVAGEPVRIPVDGAGQARWTLRDFFGQPVGQGVLDLASGHGEIAPALDRTGYFLLDLDAGAGGRATTTLAIVPKVRPVDAARSPFGINTHFAQHWETDVIPLIVKAGIRHVRDEQFWGHVEHQKGAFVFPEELTRYMDALHEAGLDALISLDFENALYDGGETPYSDEGRKAYARYAAAVLRKYGAQIHEVSVWNEYNGDFCKGPCKGKRADTYAPMLAEAYRAIKAERPDVTVVGGAAVPIPLDFLGALFARGALANLDVVDIHPYRKAPEGVEDKLASLQGLMRSGDNGRVKPIWATELGDFPDMRANRDNEARYLVRMITLLLGNGVERTYWYLLRDFQKFVGLGLLYAPDSPFGRYAPTPAYVAYAVLINQLDGARFVKHEESGGIYSYAFARDGQQVRVVWAPGGARDATVRSPRPVTFVDLMGVAHAAPQTAGAARIAVGDAPLYVLGPVDAIEPAKPGG